MTDERSILDEEHEELVEMLGEVVRKKTGAGKLFSDVLRIFRHHLDKQNETVAPLLAYLQVRPGEYRAQDKGGPNLAQAKFEDSCPEMMWEHEEMAKLAQDFLKSSPDKLASDPGEHTLHHVQLKEELLYPAAFASGGLAKYELELLGDKIKY